MERFKSRHFNLEVTHGGIALSNSQKEGTFLFSAGEGDMIRAFLGTIWKLTGLPTMPKHLTNPSGALEATTQDGVVELKKAGTNKGLNFLVGECDWVIDAVDAGVAKYKDVYSLSPQPRGTGQYTYTGPNDSTDIFEGR